jgi:hypothetical protein
MLVAQKVPNCKKQTEAKNDDDIMVVLSQLTFITIGLAQSQETLVSDTVPLNNTFQTNICRVSFLPAYQ